MKDLKVGVLIDRLNVGGVEKIAIEEVISLRKIGVNATLIVLRRKGVVDSAFKDLRKNIPIIFLDDRLHSLLKLSFNFPVFHFFSLFHITYPLFIPFVIHKGDFNYIFSHGTYTSFTAISIKKIKRIPYSVFLWDPIVYILNKVYTDKSSLPLGLFMSIGHFLDKMIISNSEHVLVGGDAHNKYIKKFTSNIVIIPPSVTPAKSVSQKKNMRILLVTAWKKGKNPEFLFKLLEKNSEFIFDVAGSWIDPKYRKEFQTKINTLGYKKNIHIIGGVSEKELSLLYQKALVVLQINDDKGFGMPALEAAGNGTTFIIPKGQGVCKLFKDGVDGYFVREKNIDEIYKYLMEFIFENTKAIKMGKHAWETVVNNYSWEKHAKKMEKVLLVN